jgi:DNA-binding ferritin-like protein (Dps family)
MDGDKYEFQELPYQYCKITGKNLSWGFQFDFDMNWFLKMGLSLDQYPPIFKRMMRRVNNGKNQEKYDPSNELDNRKGTYALWTQTSSLPDKGNFACFKMNSDIYASMPYLTPMLNDAVNKPLIRELQNNQYIIAAQKIMIGLIPLLKDQKSGQIKDALAVSPETMGRFLGLLKKGLSDAIKITGAPFEDVKQVEFDLPETSMYDQFSKIEAANSGTTSRLIYSSDKMSSSEVEMSTELDRIIAESVYPQYERWLSSMVNYFTKKYKFNFHFKGSKFTSNREKRLERALKLADKGIVDFQEIASACGQDIFEFEEKLMFSSNSNIWNNLRLLPNTNTKDMGDSEVGRPKTDTPADSTERSDDYVKEK